MYGSHTAWFSNEGPSWGLTSLPCKEVSLLGDIPDRILKSRNGDLFHVLISSPFFQGSPCQSQSHKMRACISASPSRTASLQPSQEALQHLLSATGSSVCPLLLSSAAPPVFWGWLAHARCRISSQNSTTQPKAEQMGPWPTARQKQSSEPCVPAADPILPSLPAATDSLGHQDRPLRCLAVTAAKLTLNAGGSCLRVRVSGRCTGYSALPYGVRLPSRAINTTAGRRQQQKALKPSLLCLEKSPPWAGGAKACRGEALDGSETLTAEK